MEDLKAKSAQMEAELSKLGDELKEYIKRQEEINKKQEDNNRRLEERIAAMVSNQLKSSNKAADERMKLVKMLSSKVNTIETRKTSTANANTITHNHSTPILTLTQENEFGREREKGLTHGMSVGPQRGGGHEIEFEEELEYTMGSEDLRRGEEFLRQYERRRTEREQPIMGGRINLPKLDFSKFNGTDHIMWKINCEFYFYIYQIPEEYKTRMAIMNFEEDLHVWYIGLVNEPQQLP